MLKYFQVCEAILGVNNACQPIINTNDFGRFDILKATPKENHVMVIDNKIHKEYMYELMQE